MPKTILLEGDISAADTFTSLATRGSETSPSVQLPTDWSTINRIIVAVAHDQAAAGSAVFILRLSGPAVRGTQDIVIAASGGTAVQAGSDAAPLDMVPLEIPDADIDVEGGDTINVQAAMTDTDLGTARVVVSLYGA